MLYLFYSDVCVCVLSVSRCIAFAHSQDIIPFRQIVCVIPCFLPLPQAENTEVVMAEVDAVSQQFSPFASTCSRLYFTLQQLPELHFLYQISLSFFLEIVDRVLEVKAAGTDRMS